MKQFIFFISVLFVLEVSAQKVKDLPPSFTNEEITTFRECIDFIDLPYIDIKEELKETTDKNGYRYGLNIVSFGQVISLDVMNVAERLESNDGYVYILKLKHSVNSSGFQLKYEEFCLVEGAKFYTYHPMDASDKNYIPPLTIFDNHETEFRMHGENYHWNELIIELFVPKDATEKNRILIHSVHYNTY